MTHRGLAENGAVKTIGPAEFAELLARHDPHSADGVLKLTDAQLDGIVLRARDLSSCVLVRCRLVGAVFDRRRPAQR